MNFVIQCGKSISNVTWYQYLDQVFYTVLANQTPSRLSTAPQTKVGQAGPAGPVMDYLHGGAAAVKSTGQKGRFILRPCGVDMVKNKGQGEADA